jgi:hypothetical protein
MAVAFVNTQSLLAAGVTDKMTITTALACLPAQVTIHIPYPRIACLSRTRPRTTYRSHGCTTPQRPVPQLRG